MLLMFYLVAQAGASRASIITYINPVVATLLGAGLLHESLGAGGFIAFASHPDRVVAGDARRRCHRGCRGGLGAL